jgi:membrane-associated phospholipid phosphatase
MLQHSARPAALQLAAALTATVVVVDALWLALGRVTIDTALIAAQVASLLAIVAGMMLVDRLVAWRLAGDNSAVARHLKALAASLTPIAVCTGLMAVFCLAGVILSYLAASLALPLQDDALARFDRALGLDWPAMIAWLAAYPALTQGLVVAYNSIFIQAPLVVVMLAIAGRREQLSEFMGALVLAGTLAVLISAVLPAVGGYTFHKLDPAGTAFAGPLTGIWYLEEFLQVRAGTLAHIDIRNLQGLIQFPSFHSALAVLFAVYVGTFSLLRWPALALNGVMLFSTLPIGGHHLADTLGGMAIAALSVHAMRRLHTNTVPRQAIAA